MSTAQFRWGKLARVSNDKGPYKLATFSVDGVDREAHIFDVSGIQTNPQKDSLAFLICPDGDEGRAIAFVLPPPEKRIDGQKEGESTFANHVTGNTVQHQANGDTVVKTKGVFHVNPA